MLFGRRGVDGLSRATVSSYDIGHLDPIREIAGLIAERLNPKVIPAREWGYESLVHPSDLLAGWKAHIDLPTGIDMVIRRMNRNE